MSDERLDIQQDLKQNLPRSDDHYCNVNGPLAQWSRLRSIAMYVTSAVIYIRVWGCRMNQLKNHGKIEFLMIDI